MNTDGITPAQKKRRYRERILVVLALILIVSFGLVEGWFFQLQSDLPLTGNILLFAFININVILLLILAYLVLRNIVKLVFERKRNILGHQLRTRLVIASIGLTLIPTIPLFWLATQLIFSSLDHWLSQQVGQSLEESVSFAKDYLKQAEDSLAEDKLQLQTELVESWAIGKGASIERHHLPPALLSRLHFHGCYYFNGAGELAWEVQKPGMPTPDVFMFRSILAREPENSVKPVALYSGSKQEGLITRIVFRSQDEPVAGIDEELVVLRLLPTQITERLQAITTGYEDYLQLKLLHSPLKRSHFITFSIVTLLTIFAAIWFGFFMAKSLTVPIRDLVSATQKVAEGDLDVYLQSDRRDELGMLITSFNRMVRDLRESREQLAGAHLALQQSHGELEDRRRYMEIVLKNVGAGVVSVDAKGRIMTMNKSAEATFGLEAEQVRGSHYSEFLGPDHMEIVQSFLDMHRQSRQLHLEQKVQVIVGNRPIILLIKASVLKDDRDERIGVVAVFDDLTELEKAQRMAAWREVARRIAHEIKNPLTPIQLSAQRLRRKHAELLEGDGSVFDECTRTIIQQVEHMKHLVNEFSKFARLPRAQLVPSDLCAIVEESLALYRHNYHNISFLLEKPDRMPPLRLDPDQMHQVMINLLENAIHALGDAFGQITVRLSHDPVLKIARLECADTGHGISAEDKLRIFEPYYSTKLKGTGLGLAIVAGIVADHNGFVRVRDNDPRGTVITVELPG